MSALNAKILATEYSIFIHDNVESQNIPSFIYLCATTINILFQAARSIPENRLLSPLLFCGSRLRREKSQQCGTR